MRATKEGYCVAVLGADSLLGKELLAVLEDRHFPISRLVTFESEEEEPDLPIVDLREGSETLVRDHDVAERELDFAFLATRPARMPAFLEFMDEATKLPWPVPLTHCRVIDLIGRSYGLSDRGGPPAPRALRVPFLDDRFGLTVAPEPGAGFYISLHPAAIVISALLLRLARRFPVVRAVAEVFGSASEIGSRAIEELQKQTVNLLGFQKIPRSVFGGQLAFNVLPRLGRSSQPTLVDLEARLRQQLREYLGSRAPWPALRLVQTPVFHSLALSLFVETSEPANVAAVDAALAGGRIVLRRASQDAPSQVEVAGTDEILVDSVAIDAQYPCGIWIWAAADNLHLAALNAVEIAESLRSEVRP